MIGIEEHEGRGKSWGFGGATGRASESIYISRGRQGLRGKVLRSDSSREILGSERFFFPPKRKE